MKIFGGGEMNSIIKFCVGNYLFLSLFVQAADMPNSSQEEQLKNRCAPPSSQEEVVYSNDFKWGMSLEEMKTKFEEMYHSGKRLKSRAFHNGKDVVLPINNYGGETTYARLTKEFIQNVTDHIEQGLKNTYVNYIMFPDMGHSHIFIPQKFYEEVLASIPAGEKHLRYEKMLAHEGVRFLYHTAEQLSMVDENGQLSEDRKVQWRFFTRNLVGYNDGSKRVELLHNEEHGHNTARSYHPGYRYWGAGFNITGTSKGCFPYQYKGKTYYFDLSLEDLPMNSSSGNGGFDF